MTRKVLVVDDDTIILDLLEIILKEVGYAVTMAGNGEEAVKLLAKEDFDIVITDLEMGSTSGFAVITAARQQGRDTVVIMITGCCSGKYESAAYRHGANVFLPKPFAVNELLECIHLHEVAGLCPEALGVSASFTKCKAA